MLEHADTIITVGLWLSVASLLLVAVIIWNVWRRPALPEAAYGGVALTTRRVRWLWTLALLGATALGSANDPVVRKAEDGHDPDVAAAAAPTAQRRTVSRSVPMPFYRYEREDVFLDGEPVAYHELRGFVLPGPLLWALLAYLFLVVRFNPDSRWTRRILHGRGKRDTAPPSQGQLPGWGAPPS